MCLVGITYIVATDNRGCSGRRFAKIFNELLFCKTVFVRLLLAIHALLESHNFANFRVSFLPPHNIFGRGNVMNVT
jgi:hypothetical protein